MFYQKKYSLLWIFIGALILSQASGESITLAENEICDEECLLSKSDESHLKNENKRSSTQEQCSLQGIDTSASDEPFLLFGMQSHDYDIQNLTEVCDCSSDTQIAKHVVIKKETDNKITLTDAYVSCEKRTNNDQILEDLIFDYIKNIPERTLGNEPLLGDNNEHCLDEDGFTTEKLPGEIPCFSYITAFSNETYTPDNRLAVGDVNYYSGPYSVNRIKQSEDLVHSGKRLSMLGLFYTLGQTCDINKLDTVDKNYCYSYFNNIVYSVICCCNKSPGQCALRRYENKGLICAIGKFTMHIEDGFNVSYPIRTAVEEMKEAIVNKTSCSSYYTFDSKSITYEMPAPEDKECDVGAKSKGHCLLKIPVCPSADHKPSLTNVICCCRDPDLCNVDFVAMKAVDRFRFMITKRICYQPMIYSILFARRNYTVKGDDKQPLCYMHYDENHPSARYFLANKNMQLLRDVDYEAYRKEDCNVIAATILPVDPACTNESYTKNDTEIPRPLFVCTCNGSRINEKGKITTEEATADEHFCDYHLYKNINLEYEKRKDELMPKCLVTKNPIKNFDETISFDNILKIGGSMNMATKSIFCYMEVVKDSNNDTKTFFFTAGIASYESGYGEKCLNLYNKTRDNQKETEKAFCSELEDDKILCCTIGMDNSKPTESNNKPAEMNSKSIELLDEITEKVAEQKAFNPSKKFIKKYKSLRCRSSIDFKRECEQPHGCFWTDSSDGQVKTNFYGGCIDEIPKLLEQYPDNPIYRSLRTCLTISKLRRLSKFDEKEKASQPFRCFATNEINRADEKDVLTNVFVVCCCTEIDENGKCERKDNSKKIYGQKVIDVGNNKYSKQHKNQIYPVPF